MKIFYSKPAIALYVGVIVLIASLFGLAEPACDLAEKVNVKTEICEAINVAQIEIPAIEAE